MDISERLSNTWRSIFKAMAIYAAVAWAIIEVIDFAVSKYGLSRLLLDTAVLVAFGGGMVTAVLAWFHGESGPQKAKASEITTVISIILAIGAGVIYLAMRDPIAPFNDLEGYRLTFEFRDVGDERDEKYLFTVGPLASSEILESAGVIYNLTPDEGFIEGPNVEVEFKGHPVMMLAPAESEWMIVTFVLPFEPVEIANLHKSGTVHDGLKFSTRNLNAIIDTGIEIIEQPSGATIRLID